MKPAILIASLLAAPALAAQNPRAKPVVMPFAEKWVSSAPSRSNANPRRYGYGATGAWFSVSMTFAHRTLDLVPSNTLINTWIPTAALCAGSDNVTACGIPYGGLYPNTITDSSTALTSELVDNVYGSTPLAPSAQSERYNPLGISGKGYFDSLLVELKSNTGDFAFTKPMSIGMLSADRPAAMANGYISLQTIAQKLYDDGFSPGPNYHLLIGEAAETNSSSVPKVASYDAGKYVLIFGGYDSAVFDLNRTQQHAMIKVGTGRRMQLTLDDIVYRWTEGGDTDNSLLPAPTAAIIDTTTPFLWMPSAAVAKLAGLVGARWNASLDGYVMPRFCEACPAAQDSAYKATLDLRLARGGALALDFGRYMRLQSLLAEHLAADSLLVLPVRALADARAPVVLGRAAMAGIHLWADYAESYFCVAPAPRAPPKQAIVAWSPGAHAPITNASVLAAPLPPAAAPAPAPSASPSSAGAKKSVVPMVAGIGAAAVCAAAAVLAALCVVRRRRLRAAAPEPGAGFIKMNELDSRSAPAPAAAAEKDAWSGYPLPAQPVYEMQNPPAVYEMQHPPPVHEMPGGAQAGKVYHEMPGGTYR